MKIKIGDYEFRVRAPYAEGMSLTKGEASALNAHRAEQLRKRLSQTFARWQKVKNLGLIGVLSFEDIEEFQKKVALLDEEFDFEPRDNLFDEKEPDPSNLPAVKAGTLQAELRACALDTLRERLLAMGDEAPELTKEQKIKMVLELENDTSVQIVARDRFVKRKTANQEAIHALLDVYGE